MVDEPWLNLRYPYSLVPVQQDRVIQMSPTAANAQLRKEFSPRNSVFIMFPRRQYVIQNHKITEAGKGLWCLKFSPRTTAAEYKASASCLRKALASSPRDGLHWQQLFEVVHIQDFSVLKALICSSNTYILRDLVEQLLNYRNTIFQHSHHH